MCFQYNRLLSERQRAAHDLTAPKMLQYSLGKMNQQSNSYMTTTEASETLGYTLQHTRYLLRSGLLSGIKMGRDWLVVRDAVVEYRARKQPDGGRGANDNTE